MASGEDIKQAFVQLGDPASHGVAQFRSFFDGATLADIAFEIGNPERISWRDTHAHYRNQRGLLIVQNHDTFALQLDRGAARILTALPQLTRAADRVSTFVRGIGGKILPSLLDWAPNELSLHRYDDPKVGLSRHKDNLRFVGVVAIASLHGRADLLVEHGGQTISYLTKPGDLVLLRAPGLVDTDADLRPEHAVANLQTLTRTSMMLRKNSRPDDPLPGFAFDNMPQDHGQ